MKPIDKTVCPYCLASLEEGKVRVEKSSKLWWLPKNVELSLFFAFTKRIVKKGGVVFYDNPLTVISVKARFCRSCNYIFIDGNENNAQYKKDLDDSQ